jgi:heme/copper-type cytochrome/quinol oxidase subunit 3
MPGVALILLVVSGFPIWLSARGIQQKRGQPVHWGLILAIILGAIYIGVNLYSYTQLGFDHRSQAFGSIFMTLGGYQMVTALGGVIMLAVALFSYFQSGARNGEVSPSRHQSLPDITLFWNYVIVAGLLTYLLLYVVPYFI